MRALCPGIYESSGVSPLFANPQVVNAKRNSFIETIILFLFFLVLGMVAHAEQDLYFGAIAQL